MSYFEIMHCGTHILLSVMFVATTLEFIKLKETGHTIASCILTVLSIVFI